MITQVLHAGTNSRFLKIDQAGCSSWFTRFLRNRYRRDGSGNGNFGSNHFGGCVSGRVWRRARCRAHTSQRRNFSVFIVVVIPGKAISKHIIYTNKFFACHLFLWKIEVITTIHYGYVIVKISFWRWKNWYGSYLKSVAHSLSLLIYLSYLQTSFLCRKIILT